MSLLDIIILLFIGVCVVAGFRQGLVKQLLELAGIVIAFIVASRYGVAFGQWLSGFLKLENFATKITARILNVDTSGLVADVVTSSVPSITELLYNFLGYILLFFLTLGGIKLLALLIEMVTKLPVLGTADKVAGVVLGLLKGFLIALVSVWVINLLPIPWAMEAIESSTVAQTLLNIAPGLYERIFDPGKFQEVIGTVKQLQGVLP